MYTGRSRVGDDIVDLALACLVSVYQKVKGEALAVSKQTPVLYKVSWAFYSTLYPGAVLVTLIYWVALYSGMESCHSKEHVLVHCFPYCTPWSMRNVEVQNKI